MSQAYCCLQHLGSAHMESLHFDQSMDSVKLIYQIAGPLQTQAAIWSYVNKLVWK